MGVSLIQGLKGFPYANMEEILRLREEIKDYRQAYQVEVGNISKNITALPFSEDMMFQIREEYRLKVEPRLLDLQRKIDEGSVKYLVNREIRDRTGDVVGSVLTAVSLLFLSLGAFSGMVGISPDVAIGAALTAIKSTADLVGEFTGAVAAIKHDRDESANLVRREGLYYLHQINNLFPNTVKNRIS